MSARNQSFFRGLFLSLTLTCAALLAGCGKVPDLKVQVSLIPKDATYLWALVWVGTGLNPSNMMPIYTTINEQLLFPTVPPTTTDSMLDAYSYSFGLKMPETDHFVSVSVAAFSQTSNGFCFRQDGTAVQPAGYRVLTVLPVLMTGPMASLGVPTSCYDTLDGQTKPLVTGVSAELDRDAGSSLTTGTVFVRGWNFRPDTEVSIVASVFDPMTRMQLPDMEIINPSDPNQVERGQPNEIRVRLDPIAVRQVQNTTNLVVTLKNSGTTLVYSTPIFN